MMAEHFVISLTGKQDLSACRMKTLSIINLLMVSSWEITVLRMQHLVLLLRVEMLRNQMAVLATLPMIAYLEDVGLREVPKFASNHVLLLNRTNYFFKSEVYLFVLVVVSA
jgi:hypothetical protein